MAACIINIPEMPRIKANTITIREAIMVEYLRLSIAQLAV